MLLFLISKITQWEDQYSFTLVSEIFVNLLSVQTQKNILFTFCNPLKILCLIYEIFNHALNQEVHSKSNILECISKYKNSFISFWGLFSFLIKIQNEKQLMNILLNKDLDQRYVVFIIHQNNIFSVIKDIRF